MCDNLSEKIRLQNIKIPVQSIKTISSSYYISRGHSEVYNDTISVSLILRLGTFPEDTKIESDTIAAFLSFGRVHLTGLSEKLCLIFGKINFRVQTKSKATTQQRTLVKKNILPTVCISKHKLQTANFRIQT